MDLSIGEAAARTGVAASTLRYYEQVGLLPLVPRVGGRRRFSDKEVQIVEVLRFAQKAGFTLDEIRTLFHDYRDSTGPGARWRELAQVKLRELARLEQSISDMRSAIAEGLKCGCLRLEDCALARRPQL